ncbi:hypothetical protein [Arenibacterium sp. LLYu02]|uniref:hypothetical protein n=1 Tax=Arenibacterium sp. LLYu02 TaxID=3404132 RepID=UPI003B20EAAD
MIAVKANCTTLTPRRRSTLSDLRFAAVDAAVSTRNSEAQFLTFAKSWFESVEQRSHAVRALAAAAVRRACSPQIPFAIGNLVVLAASQTFPLAATDLYQVFETTEAPGSAANLKLTWINYGRDMALSRGQSNHFFQAATEVKTVGIPNGAR